MADYSRTLGDTAPSFYAVLEDGDGDPANLTDATIKFIMRAIRGPSPKVFAPAVIENAVTAMVRYDPVAEDVDTEGGYFVDWEVTYADGKIETFPNDRSMTAAIYADLGAVMV